MNAIEIAVVVIVALLFASVVAYMVYRKVTHKSVGCDCGGACSSCPHCCSSEHAPEKDGEAHTLK